MLVLDGKAVAAFHREQVVQQIGKLRGQGIAPELAIILAGDDKASAVYARAMQKVAKSVGLEGKIYQRDASVRESELLDLLRQLNETAAVKGILHMMPLPAHIDTDTIIRNIAPQKDVDGLTDSNVAGLIMGRPCFVPATPKAVMATLDYYHISLEGKEVAIVGRSNVVGKPLAQLCLQRNATVTVCHSRTKDLASVTKRADVLIAAVGKAHLITADMVRPGAVVIDVGINSLDGKIVGDVDYDGVAAVASALTPVPGGIGSVTTMMIVEGVAFGPTQFK
jgi:methylenetetrahydrofolate dehydrogenase (NADP+)/methenyltetrahydrofolate cyclohydrolase